MKYATAALAVATALATAGPAGAQTVTCGQVITKSTKVTNDLTNCPGNGLLIGADNITLDLNGHTIDGDEVAHPGAFEAGIRNGVHDGPPGHNGVTIKNGLIQEFDTGVGVQNASHNVLSSLRAVRNGRGITVGSSNDLVASGNLIRRNSVSQNRGYGITLSGADNRVRRNLISNNDTGVVVTCPSADGNVIEKNTAAGNGYSGIVFSDADCGQNLVRDNLLVANGVFGIFCIESHSVVFEGNRVFRSGDTGIAIDCGPNVLRRNVSSENGDDGISVAGGNTVAKNRANDNGDLGIEASPGVIDGGGNRASGNGDPLQCLNVFCR
jgi:parallel beta-helix repeat protein